MFIVFFTFRYVSHLYDGSRSVIRFGKSFNIMNELIDVVIQISGTSNVELLR